MSKKKLCLKWGLILLAGVIAISSIIIVVAYNSRIDYPWYFSKLKVESARYKNNEKINVAIIDSGFNTKYSSYFNAEVIRYDASEENNCDDATGHGTQMALLIGSNSNIKNSFYGINPNVNIYSIRAINSLGLTNTTILHNAFEICKKIDISIINVSLGGSTYSSIIEEDVNYFKNKGVFVNCACGDTKSKYLYPADLESSYCVSAQDETGNLYSDSNYESHASKKTILVPGVNIDVAVTGDDGEKYNLQRSGSSFATAIFSGYISLWLSLNNGNNVDLFDRLLSEDKLYDNNFLDILD